MDSRHPLLDSILKNTVFLLIFVFLSLIAIDSEVRFLFIIFTLLFTTVAFLQLKRELDLTSLYLAIFAVYYGYDITFNNLVLFLFCLLGLIFGIYVYIGRDIAKRKITDTAAFWLAAGASVYFQWKFAGLSPVLMLNVMLAVMAHIGDKSPISYALPWISAILHVFAAHTWRIAEGAALIITALPYLVAAFHKNISCMRDGCCPADRD